MVVIKKEYVEEGVVSATVTVGGKFACGRWKQACNALFDVSKKIGKKLNADVGDLVNTQVVKESSKKVGAAVNKVAMLPSPGQSSFNLGERLVSRSIYDDFILGQQKFKLGAPWDHSFFFNKPGENTVTRSLDAAVNAGFTRNNIMDTVNSGGNELMRLIFKTDKLNQIAVPGRSKIVGGVGDGVIPGTNALFTGTGKTKTIYGDDGFDEFIGNNVFLKQEDIISVESLGRIKK